MYNMKILNAFNGNYSILFFAVLMMFSFAACDSEETDTPDNLVDTTVIGTNFNAMEDERRRTIEITASNMEYSPSEITATPGEQLTIRLVNNGQEAHNIEFELPSGEQELDTNVQPGETATLNITAPDSTGSYTFYCPVENHHQKGMEGKLIVK